MKGPFLTSIFCAAIATGCATDAPPRLSETTSASTVGDYVNMGCSSAVVLGLSMQIIEQANCDHPGAFAPFTASAGITFASNAVLPYLDKSASDDVAAVAETDPLTITSGLRTLAQQYLLDSWAQQSMCGLTADAPVGSSTHEAGHAVDISSPSATLISDMAAHGWAHTTMAAVHFDHTSSPANTGYDVHAFQVLWNLNNPSDQIATNGMYGAETEARLMATSATGFAMGAMCSQPPPPPPPGTRDAEVVSIRGPERALPEISIHYAIVLKNTGTVDWPKTTQLTLANGSTSKLQDPSWTSATVVTTIGTAVPVGAMGTVTFNVKTPAATVDTPVAEKFALDDAGMQFGMIDLALTVSPSMEGSGSGGPSPNMSNGGCNANGGAGGSLVLLLALAGLVRPRSRR